MVGLVELMRSVGLVELMKSVGLVELMRLVELVESLMLLLSLLTLCRLYRKTVLVVVVTMPPHL